MKRAPSPVIFLFMEGGPSHIDTFDPKPEVRRLHGQPLPTSIGRVVTPMGVGGAALLGSQRTFRKYGQSGIDVSDWLPHIATCVDDHCCDSLLLGQRPKPCWLRVSDEHRVDFGRSAKSGFLGHLRFGQRESESTWLCG